MSELGSLLMPLQINCCGRFPYVRVGSTPYWNERSASAAPDGNIFILPFISSEPVDMLLLAGAIVQMKNRVIIHSALSV